MLEEEAILCSFRKGTPRFGGVLSSELEELEDAGCGTGGKGEQASCEAKKKLTNWYFPTGSKKFSKEISFAAKELLCFGESDHKKELQ